MRRQILKRLVVLLLSLHLAFGPLRINPAFAGIDLPNLSMFKSGEFTTEDVAIQSLNLDCLEYCFTGICVALYCTVCGVTVCCTINTSPQVTHWMPDFVISGYNDPGDIAWSEAKTLLGPATEAAAAAILGVLIDLPTYGGGHALDWKEESSERQRTERNSQMYYKEVSVIGNPIVAILSLLLSSSVGIEALARIIREYLEFLGLADDVIAQLIEELGPLLETIEDLADTVGGIPLCPSDVDLMYPYFQSEFDALTWRFGLPELLYPATWVPGMREIGKWPLHTWGSVHPRQGFLTAIEEPKAAGVMAQRAIDVVTRDDQPHIYTHYEEAGPSNEDEDKWLMISPIKDEECEPFGNPDYSLGDILHLGDERTVSDGKFGWLYWNEYDCCPWKKGVLIAVIPIPPVCLF